MPELLAVISALIASTETSDDDDQVLELIKKVGDLRTTKGFEAKESADAVLATAMRVLGPKVVLEILPLNLEPSDREAGLSPRAYLLPLLPLPHPSPLGHFVSYFVPLSERMFGYAQVAEAAGRESEVKVWMVLVGQVWNGLVGYCHAPKDLKEALGPEFSVLLTQLLYTQPELRSSVLRALKTLVESNVKRVSSSDMTDEDEDADEGITQAEASANVAFLAAQSESWLAVLFNVFGSTNRDGRGMVGDVIGAWAGIAGPSEIQKAYGNVAGLFKQNLAKAQNDQGHHGHGADKDTGSLAAMTQDLMILLLPHLTSKDAQKLFNTTLAPDVLGCRDSGVQKRAYKILSKLIANGKVTIEDTESVLKKLDESADSLAAAAKKARSYPYIMGKYLMKYHVGSLLSYGSTSSVHPGHSNAHYSLVDP